MKYKRVVISRKGTPEVLQVVEEELAEPGAGEARAKVLTAGVAFADVAALLPYFGGYTEFAYVPENLLVPMPDEQNPAEAVSVVLNYLTAHRMLHRSAGVKKGERILVHGAAGGVGTALLQLGKEAELEMYGTASKGKHELVSSLGAPPYSELRGASPVRRLLLTGLETVAVSRRGSPGGAVAAALPQTGSVLIPITLTSRAVSFVGTGHYRTKGGKTDSRFQASN